MADTHRGLSGEPRFGQCANLHIGAIMVASAKKNPAHQAGLILVFAAQAEQGRQVPNVALSLQSQFSVAGTCNSIMGNRCRQKKPDTVAGRVTLAGRAQGGEARGSLSPDRM